VPGTEEAPVLCLIKLNRSILLHVGPLWTGSR
jgi:hypothetical protein